MHAECSAYVMWLWTVISVHAACRGLLSQDRILCNLP